MTLEKSERGNQVLFWGGGMMFRCFQGALNRENENF
jgi:hypothetical protein